MNFLITGGAGFIGSSLANKLLTKKHKVITVDNFNNFYSPQIKEDNVKHNINNPDYKLYRIDIESMDKLAEIFDKEEIDMIIHLAGRAGVRPSIEKPVDYIKSNILGTINLLELMKKHNIKKMIFASSSSVYGNCEADIFSEDLKVTEPISPYAATKSACEQFCYTYHKLYDINIICLRFFTVYGPRQRPDLAINKFTRLIEAGMPVPVFGDGTTKRNYTYIDDIISGIEGAIEYDKTPYEIINLGGGEVITLIDMVKILEKNIGKKAIIQKLPMQPGDVNKTVCDYSKAHKLLNYTPKTTFEEGIRKFIEWRRGL